MTRSTRAGRTIWLCALALLVGVLVPAQAAQAAAGGTVVAWGCSGELEAFGQCSVPSGLSDVTAVAAGLYHSLAVTSEGTVVAWGCGTSGGINRDFGQCTVPSGLSGVSAVAAGEWQSLALRGDGSVVPWGLCILRLCDVPGDLAGVIAISASVFHNLALKGDGTVAAWGCGLIFADVGQCNVPSGLSGVTAIAAGPAQSLAVKSDGTVVGWGCGAGGILINAGQCDVPSGLTGVTAVAAGSFHSLALKSDGTVVAWGCGASTNSGQCAVPIGLSGVIAIAAGATHSLALKRNGTVVAWGCGGLDSGQCNVPPDLGGVTAIAAGEAHSLALVGPTNRPPDCSAVTAAPETIWPRTRDQLALVTLAGATDPDGDALAYHIDGVTQDEWVSGVGDDTSPDAGLTSAGASSNELFVRTEANSHFDGRVYRIGYTVTDGQGGSCSGTAGLQGTTTAKVGVPRKKDTVAIDDGSATSWDSFTGAPIAST